MTSQAKIKLVVGIALGLTLLAASTAALWRIDPFGERGREISKRSDQDVDAYPPGDPRHVDRRTIAYRQSGEWALDLEHPRAIATGPADRVYVAGDHQVLVFAAEGKSLEPLNLVGEPSCIAVGGADHKFPGAVYVGLPGRVVRLDGQGAVAAELNEGLDEASVLTSIALAEEDVFVADAGHRIVLRFGLEGKLVRRIGECNSLRGVPGFVLPSPYFDVAVTPDGLLRVAHTGARRIETYTFEGDLLGHWGAASATSEGFFGCCNPANFAVLPNGCFVTVEKGLPRVKVYSHQGVFESFVATPQELAPGTITEDARDDTRQKPFDVAADSRGRVLLLDPNSHKVRIFERQG